jgi:hypothetical protein
MKLRDLFLVEFKIANQPDPTDRDDYKAKMASLQDIQKDPRMNDARTQSVIAKRKEELRRWAEKNLKTEDNVQERMPASVIKSKQRYADMTDQELADRFKDSDEKTLRQMAWRHGYGNMSSHYFDRVQKGKSQTEDGVQATDLKRMGAEVKSLYVHKNGKTIMIPAERENDFIQKGYKRSALRTEDNMGFSDKEIKMAYGVLNNPKYKGGNMTGAVEVINKIAPGLADHPSVAKALQRTNEGEMRLDKSAFVQMLADKIKEPQKGHGRPEYDNRLLAKMYKLITGKDVDFEGNKFTITMNKPTTEDSGELSRLKELSGIEEDNGKKTVWYTITPGSEKEKGMMQAEIDQGGKITNILAATPQDLANQLMKLGVTHDDYDFGHTSDVDFPEEDEGWNNKEYGNDAHGFIQDTHEILKAKGESYQPFPEGDEFDIAEDEGTYLDEGWLDTLKAAGRKIVPDQVRALYDPATAAKVQADDQAKVQMDTLFKDINTVAGLNQTDVSQGYPADLVVAYLRKYVAPRHPDAFKRMDAQGDLKKMFAPGSKLSAGTLKGNLNKVAVELGKVNLSPDQGQQPTQQPAQQPQAVAASMDNEETVQEDAPFDGMSLVRMALMKKFITAEEWHGLKDKWKNAVAELEQRYNDWPDGEGFGSSDHNFAIKELMELVGYEFDDKDTSGRFVVSKMPPELEKMGLKNARMKDAVATEDSVKEGASMIPYFKTEKDFDGEKTTVYEFPMAWAKDKELDTPYLSNASMREFLTGLGYSGDFENMSAVPVDEFIGVSTQWLKKNIGKRSPEEPTTIDKNPDGPTMISGGKPEGYMNQQVKLHNELARKIKSKYPEVTHLGFN